MCDTEGEANVYKIFVEDVESFITEDGDERYDTVLPAESNYDRRQFNSYQPALTAKRGDPKPRQSQSKGAEQSSPRLQKNTHTDENGPSK